MSFKKPLFGIQFFQNIRQRKPGSFFTPYTLPLFLNMKYAEKNTSLNRKKEWFFNERK